MSKLSLKDIPTEVILKQQYKWVENNKKSGGMVRPPEEGFIPDFPFTYEAFSEWPEKLVFKKMEKLADEGYLEYGVSLRTAWLSDKALKFIGKD